MVNPALLASVDELDSDELDELIEYVATKRIGTLGLTDDQRTILTNRRCDANPDHWLTDDEFDAQLGTMMS